MKHIKFFAVLSVLLCLIAFSSCKVSDNIESTTHTDVEEEESTVQSQNETTDEATVYEESTAVTESTSQTEDVSETTTEPLTGTVTEAVSETVTQDIIETTSEIAEDISSWDAEKIVSFYKDTAEKTGTSVKSEQTVGLQDISVNNGQLGGVFSFVTPILSSFLSGNATVSDGITGDYNLLTADDVSSFKAYESKNGTVIEITLKEQEEKANEENRDGSVSHGISTVGDLLGIMGQLKEKGLPIEINVEKTVLRYSDPVIKVLVDENGKIVNGTWSCTVTISLSDYKFAGSGVDSTVVILDNKITVNGGFVL